MQRISGMIVPIVTPLTEEHAVDVPALSALCAQQIRAGINALFVLGTTGEFYGLTHKQRRQVVNVVLEAAAGRIPVIAGISGDSTVSALDALDACRHDDLAGYVASAPFFLSYTQDELGDFFRTLADAAGEPLILYNYPSRYRHRIEILTIESLLVEGRVSAIKDTAGDFTYVCELLELKRAFPALGVFESALANLARAAPLGIDGSVQAIANVLPDECAHLWSMIEAQDWIALEEAVGTMWAFHQRIETVAIFIAALKGCMEARGWCRSIPARPTRRVTPEAAVRLRHMLSATYGYGESDGRRISGYTVR